MIKRSTTRKGFKKVSTRKTLSAVPSSTRKRMSTRKTLSAVPKRSSTRKRWTHFTNDLASKSKPKTKLFKNNDMELDLDSSMMDIDTVSSEPINQSPIPQSSPIPLSPIPQSSIPQSPIPHLPITRSISQKKKDTTITNVKKIFASNTIGKFMKNTGEKRKGVFLKIVCSDSGACLAVGAEIKRINQFFNHYTDFTYAINPVKSIGSPSSNGFVKEITYTRDGYNSYAILKSSVSQHSDNLMYEYEVGQYINKQNKIFSCFLETYGMYVYNSVPVWNYFKDTKNTHINSLKQHTTAISDMDYRKGCPDAKYIAILIQHINNAISFDEFIRTSIVEPDLDKRRYSLNFEVFYILYQVYFALDTLKNEFTHYDLHTQNVLLYEPVKDGYITYHYHLNSGETVEFQSKYIAKIIDYGRSYYYEDAENNSKNTYDRVCAIPECTPECGKDFGFILLGPEKSPGSFFHISSQVRNKSHDLRLANIVKGYLLPRNGIIHINKELLGKIVYNLQFGTPERENGYPYTIHNVSDMRTMLESILIYQPFKEENVRYNSSIYKIGDMHMYEDRRPMEYVNSMRVE